MSKKVFVCCPGAAQTGGPEVLHQLVDVMRSLGVDAYIMYFPFKQSFSIPEGYKKYDIKVANYSEDYTEGSIVIIPEPVTRLIRYFKDSKICIWWLSVDNYYNTPLPMSLWQKLEHIKLIIKGKRKPIKSLKGKINVVQSEYARIFLKEFGIDSVFLGDYLNRAHLLNEMSPSILSGKENIVAYNPKKGFEITKRIIESNQDINFLPIENMTPEQVQELLKKSKVYIDFGSHPGKDRFPREAAMAGCCIITGKRGSAKNDIDIPIAKIYKVDDHVSTRNITVRNVILNIFDDFTYHFDQFEGYRKSIQEEEQTFRHQVELFVGKHCM
ncbi:MULTISPECIES: hypothetical protein [Pectobacterium]|uniref:hypothetical protein n=1 Tax=Pectobacterium TaxID=122277 RepID=UPI00057DC6E3|nr:MULTISPECIES: hypothetical protein [Pectobacterium]KHS95606.1 hypothetical protein RC88_10035 [Pectobacterium parvum]UVD97756.1 hypothetical protein NV347_01575 [Pectobacterium parvum]